MKALSFHVNTAKFIAAKSLGAVLGDRSFYKGFLSTIRLVDIPEPEIRGPDWVKIKTHACGFCGSDINLIRLHDSPTASPFTSFPCIIGHEMVGEIIETGPNADAFKPGIRVAVCPMLSCEVRGIYPLCCSCAAGRPGNCENFAEGDLPPGMFLGINSGLNGGFANVVIAHKSQLFVVPDTLSMESAVMTEPVAVALQTIFDNMPASGDKILVIGGGVIGNLLIQAIRFFVPDCHISVIEPAPHAAELAVECGADAVFPFSQAFAYTADTTGAKVYQPLLGMKIVMGGFNRVYDTVASEKTIKLGMRLLKAMGKLSLVGIGGDVKLDLTPLWLKLQAIQGVYGYGMATFGGKVRHVFDIALALMDEGKISADRLVTHRFALEDYQLMIEVNLSKKKHGAMKTIVVF
ncbi:MAG: alcohol dehydrogenase [Desulfobacteraceae bacterium]|nr:MAG: alcohol dehydrogenase [Desulfobacteraceae bacterium]